MLKSVEGMSKSHHRALAQIICLEILNEYS